MYVYLSIYLSIYLNKYKYKSAVRLSMYTMVADISGGPES